MTRVGAIVLAAGQSSRFRAAGGPDLTKLVAKLDGKPIVRRVVEAALATKARPVVVVTGYARDSVEAAVADLDVSVAFNPEIRERTCFVAQSGSGRDAIRCGGRARAPGRHAVDRAAAD